MNQTRLNAYHIMWLFVFFDLPTNTKTERKAANKFRKDLLTDGFNMMQYSVYTRHCASKENADVHLLRVKGFIPSKGLVSILEITDKQYGRINNFWGNKSPPKQQTGAQLEIF